MRVVEFQTSEQRDAKDLLLEAAGKGFDSVFIVGIKDGQLHIQNSTTADTAKAIGLLEAAKLHLYERWD